MNNPSEESSSHDMDSEKNKANEQTPTSNADLEAISAEELLPQPEPMLTESSNHKRLHEQSPTASHDLDATIKKIKTSESDEKEMTDNTLASAAPSTYSQHSVENFLPSPSNLPENQAPEDINLAEIIGSDELGLQKSVELAEILENPEDLLKDADDPPSSLDDKSRNDSMDFDITEKLREMGEISVKPISKAELTMNRKSESGDVVDDVSFELSKKDSLASANERKVTNLRKNIREVMDDTQLDASTLAAQRQELERLARVQEQQRIIRDVQRQIAAERQSNKTQARVMSLLQGNCLKLLRLLKCVY
jgi:RAD54-like protein 2